MKKRYIVFILALSGLWMLLHFNISQGKGSSFSYAGNGTKAFFLLLQEMGFKVQVLTSPFSTLFEANSTQKEKNSRPDVMFLISPPSFNQAEDLLKWVKQGNTLVLIEPNSPNFTQLLKLLGLSTPKVSNRALDIAFNQGGASPSTLSCPANWTSCNRAEFYSPMRLAFGWVDPSWTVVSQSPARTESYILKRSFANETNLSLSNSDMRDSSSARRIQPGTIWAFAGAEPIINDNIDKLDNLRLFYQIAQSGSKVYFDEFHHGVSQASTEQMRTTKLSIWFLTAYFLLLLSMGALSRLFRLGPADPERQIETASAADYARVVGVIYKERSITEVLLHYGESWKLRLEQATGIRCTSNAQDLIDELDKYIYTDETERTTIFKFIGFMSDPLRNSHLSVEDFSLSDDNIVKIEGLISRTKNAKRDA